MELILVCFSTYIHTFNSNVKNAVSAWKFPVANILLSVDSIYFLASFDLKYSALIFWNISITPDMVQVSGGISLEFIVVMYQPLKFLKHM